MNELFETKETVKPKNHLEVLPVSVMEIGPMGKQGIRESSDHNKQSSRSGYSPFPYEVAETCAALFLRDAKMTVDPFAGWGERGDAMKRHGKGYAGFDLSPEAIANALNKYGVKNKLVDSRFVEVPSHDGLFTCPPYWGLEKYAGNNGLDQCKQWSGFLLEYENILSRFSKEAKSGATYCIMTGDWREAGIYYDLTFQTEYIMHKLGFIPFDKVVISRLGISKVKIMLPQAKRLGYTVKVHETLSVYKKP
jgi:DNA modification methylase